MSGTVADRKGDIMLNFGNRKFSKRQNLAFSQKSEIYTVYIAERKNDQTKNYFTITIPLAFFCIFINQTASTIKFHEFFKRPCLEKN